MRGLVGPQPAVLEDGSETMSPPPATSRNARLAWAIAWAAALLLALFVVYGVSFDAPFHWDDVGHLKYKTNLHLTDLSWRAVRDALRSDYGVAGVDRPVSRLSLALTYYFAGLEPRAYRLGNVVIHWMAALALSLLVFTATGTPRVRRARPKAVERRLLVALAAATLWALHPVQTNAVTYIIQRMAALCGLFYFLCAAAYLQARCRPGGWSWGWGLSAGGCFALALGSKENAATLLLVLPAAELFLLDPPSSRRVRKALAGAVLGAVAAVSLLVFSRFDARGLLSALYQDVSFGPWQHVLAALLVQARYALTLLVPDHRLLVLDASVDVPAGLFAPPAVAGVALAVAGCLALAVRVRKKRPLLSFGIFWFFLAQVVESALLPKDLYFEHRMYVPSAFFFLGVAVLLVRLSRGERAFSAAALALLVGVELFNTYQRNVIWSDPVRLFEDTVVKAPGKVRPMLNLAAMLAGARRFDEAEDLLKRAGRLREGGRLVPLLLADLERLRGNAQRYEQRLREALGEERLPTWKARRLLAVHLISTGRLDEAEQLLSPVAENHPGDAHLWNVYGLLEARRGQGRLAEAHFRRALGYNPTLPDGWYNLGTLLLANGRTREAEAALARAVTLAPEDPRYRQALASLSGPPR